MDDFFGRGCVFNQDDNEEDLTGDEDVSEGADKNEDDDQEEMYSPDEDESFSEEI